MSKAGEPIVKDFSGKDFTCITFKPDLAKFKMESLDADTFSLLARRAYDVAGSVRGIAVYLNGKKLPVCFNLDLTVVLILLVHVNLHWVCVNPILNYLSRDIFCQQQL